MSEVSWSDLVYNEFRVLNVQFLVRQMTLLHHRHFSHATSVRGTTISSNRGILGLVGSLNLNFEKCFI